MRGKSYLHEHFLDRVVAHRGHPLALRKTVQGEVIVKHSGVLLSLLDIILVGGKFQDEFRVRGGK